MHGSAHLRAAGVAAVLRDPPLHLLHDLQARVHLVHAQQEADEGILHSKGLFSDILLICMRHRRPEFVNPVARRQCVKRASKHLSNRSISYLLLEVTLPWRRRMKRTQLVKLSNELEVTWQTVD